MLQLPHLYAVSILPSKTNTVAVINAIFEHVTFKQNNLVCNAFRWLKYLFTYLQQCFVCHCYVIIVFVYNVLHFNGFNHLHRLIWEE